MRGKRVKALRNMAGWYLEDGKEVTTLYGQRVSLNKDFRKFKQLKRIVNRKEQRSHK